MISYIFKPCLRYLSPFVHFLLLLFCQIGHSQERNIIIAGRTCADLHNKTLDSSFDNTFRNRDVAQRTSICDKNGRMLFYSRQEGIYNRRNLLIGNGALPMDGDSAPILSSIKFDDTSYAIIMNSFDSVRYKQKLNRYLMKFKA